MEKMNQVLEKAEVLMNDSDKMGEIARPALREILEHVASTKTKGFAYKKHSDHSKTSTKGCVMGCVGG